MRLRSAMLLAVASLFAAPAVAAAESLSLSVPATVTANSAGSRRTAPTPITRSSEAGYDTAVDPSLPLAATTVTPLPTA